MPDRDFWKGKRVLLTGHTGFKGSWMAIWLHCLGAKVTGVALPPGIEPNLFTLASVDELLDSRFCDIRNVQQLQDIVADANPEIVLHLAAQALVRKSYREPQETFATNIMGTTNVLEAIKNCQGVRVAIMVTTDKVYEITDPGRPFSESDRLGGHDPYSASKAASEIVISSYRKAFLAGANVAVASARAGNVIGGGDWSEDRLIPDAIKAWHKDVRLNIRMPNAIRPWQHVLDPLCGYLTLAEVLWTDVNKSSAYNFGPDESNNASVKKVVEIARKFYKNAKVLYGKTTEEDLHETGILRLSTEKAKQELNFSNRYALDSALRATFNWYREHDAGQSARVLCLKDIDDYTRAT